MNISDLLYDFQKNMEKLEVNVGNELKQCPDGELRCYERLKQGKHYNHFCIVNKREKRYITKDTELVKTMAKKMYLTALKKIVETNLNGIKYLDEKILGVGPEEVLSMLPQWVHPLIELPRYENYILPVDPLMAAKIKKWMEEPYQHNDKYPEELKHRTSGGVWVRSKSEALIIELIEQIGIPNKYECGIIIDGIWFFPDVTLMRSDGKLFYLEHCGMMRDRRYRDSVKRKLEMYESVGICPWDNLILTYDNEDGNIDLKLIKAEIQSRLII